MFHFDRLIDTLNAECLQQSSIHNLYNKYIGHIELEDLFTVDTVYCSALRAACGFYHKKDTLTFISQSLVNSYLLTQQVLSQTFKPQYYKTRVITERGKSRVIKPPTFECKVVQKVICDYLIRPLLEPKMIQTSYASVQGRGTAKMRTDIMHGLRSSYCCEDSVFIQTDFKNYFASIDVSILLNMLARYIRDPRIIDLIAKFSPVGEGLSLGNELSQIPASFFPSPLDHAIKDKKGLKYYFRYMDDTLAIVNKQDVKDYMELFQYFSDQLKLTIKEIHVIPYGKNFIFCKEHYNFNKNTKRYYVNINPTIVKTERRKLKKFSSKIENNVMPIDKALNQYKGVRGFIASHENTYRILQELDALANKTIGFEIEGEKKDG